MDGWFKGMLGGTGGSQGGGSGGGGGAKSDRERAKRKEEGGGGGGGGGAAAPKEEPTTRRRRRDREYDRITAIAIPRYRMSPSHVEYTVEIRKAGVAWTVNRRYQQFKKLHADLTALCPMTTPYHCEYGVVPVLCGSSWTEVTNHSTELVERRRRFLEIYLEQLIVPKNKFYQQRTALYSFLHDDEVVLSSKPGTTPLPGLGAGGGVIEVTEDSPREDQGRSAPLLLMQGPSVSVSPPQPFQPTSAPVPPIAAPISGATTQRPLESVGCASVPGPSFASLLADAGARDGAVTSPRPGSRAVSPQDKVVTPDADAGKDDIFERCIECGRMEVVDYSVASWEDFGPCDTCLRYTRWQLVQQVGDRDPVAISHETALVLQARGGAPESGDVTDGVVAEDNSETSPRAPPPVPDPQQVATAEHTPPMVPKAPPLSGSIAEREKSVRGRAPTTASEMRPEWKQDADVRNCELCGDAFTFFLRKHHCRRCGGIYCGTCAGFSAVLADYGYNKEVRVCRTCKLKTQSTEDGAIGNEDYEDTDNIPLGRGARDEDEEVLQQHEPPRSVVEHGNLAGLPLRRELRPTDFELVTTLGKGTFGKVMKVAHRDTGNVYAMKVLSKKVVHKRRMVEYIRDEKEILSRLQHPFIVSLHASFQTDHHLYLILEFLPGGELYTHIYSQGRFGEADARFYSAEIALALEYLHAMDIVHRDIKPENIVLDREGHARLTDFGLAKMNFSKSTRRSFVGSAEYLAPETVRGDPQTCATDWWSLGVLLFEMLVGMAPFNGPNNNDVYQQILHKELDFTAARIRSADAVGLLQQLLMKDPKKRLKEITAVKADPFWATIDWQALLAREVRPPFVPDLSHNDTRYFSREFTHEWAKIETEKIGRNSLDLLSTKFDNFPVAGSAVNRLEGPAASAPLSVPVARSDRPLSGPLANYSGVRPMATSPRALAGRQDGLNLLAGNTMEDGMGSTTPVFSHVTGSLVAGGIKGGTARTPEELALLEHQQLLRDFCGEWTLRSLEVTAEDGRVTFPWGPDAVGQAMYTTHGLFSMQLASPKELRPRFRDPDYKKVTREEMAEAYIGYVAFFGTFTHTPGRNYIQQQIHGSLCPNWTASTQKRYFKFVNSQSQPDRDHLVLTTSPIGVDGEAARTVMRFERVKGDSQEAGAVAIQLATVPACLSGTNVQRSDELMT
eukprot:Hpha_TRINITY_DN15751_c1_g1::TRINITY_DN15751_c1_g1_i1::g.40784::m.40784